MSFDRPFPSVGSRIKRDWGPENQNTWACAGVVRAIVDDQVMVIRRWVPHERYHAYTLIDYIEWSMQNPIENDGRGLVEL